MGVNKHRIVNILEIIGLQQYQISQFPFLARSHVLTCFGDDFDIFLGLGDFLAFSRQFEHGRQKGGQP